MFVELVWTLPFIVLLACIALVPLLHKHWWEKNFLFLSFGLGLLVIFHYLFQLRDSENLLRTALEYFSFICLIGSLFVVSGGIHITVKGEATPLVNSVYLFVAALLSNLLGTTGASMVFVRPWLRMNKYRLTAHHIVFFIFIVSNVGGCLTPIGDPPLFLGYLKGVPFWWVLEKCWAAWTFAVLGLISIFYGLDRQNFLRAPRDVREAETREEIWKIDGLRNLAFLGLILGAVFIKSPPGLSEALMIGAALGSWWLTSKPIHEANDFNFAPIKEVAILFLGIFATMIPALQWLEHHAQATGIRSAGQFFWASGILSSVLDNAPTYLNFLSAAIGLFVSPEEATHHGSHVAALLMNHAGYIRAISVGSVFFGAMTYIGNGPNFLVKSIADQADAKTPSFFGYVLCYSAPVLVPLFTLVWFLFFRS